MNPINLTPLKNELSDEELQEYELGQTVEISEGAGMIVGMAEENFEYPVGSADRVERIEEEDEDVEMEEIEASPENPVYIVSLVEGGSVAVTPDEISEIDELPGEGEDIESPEEVQKQGSEAEMSAVYEYCDGDPHDGEVFESAKRKYIHENYAAELGQYVDDHDSSLAVLEEMSAEELINIPGVDDPHVGFDELPPGWNRKSVLQAWASLGGMWRTCYARMVRTMGPNFAKRWCSAMKDEVLRTEEWRGKF